MLTNGIQKIEMTDIYEMESVPNPFGRDLSPEKVRLDMLRKISNVTQALENLIVQCEDVEQFKFLQDWAKRELNKTYQQLRMQIHQ